MTHNNVEISLFGSHNVCFPKNSKSWFWKTFFSDHFKTDESLDKGGEADTDQQHK